MEFFVIFFLMNLYDFFSCFLVCFLTYMPYISYYIESYQISTGVENQNSVAALTGKTL
jgi:hypothetical protein